MKKFSDKYINQFDILRKSIVGFEFEFNAGKSYYKMLEYLNRELYPIKVSGYRKYHSSFKPTKNHFKIELDSSLSQESGIELVTGPLDYINSKIILLKILKMIDEYGTTDDKCSLHINISFDKDQTDNILDYLNPLKLILKMDEDKVYSYFPNRKDNFYAKSVKKMIPFKDYDFYNIGADKIINSLELPDTRYYGINIKNSSSGRLEFRYIGGSEYHKKTNEILDLMDYFILLTYECINSKIDEEDASKLKKYLNENINNYKKFRKLENFISEFPSIKLQIDKSDNYDLLMVYYDRIFEKLYDIITNIYNLSDCIINYDTDVKKLEIVEANFKTIFDIRNVVLINCNIDGGSFSNCQFVDCEFKHGYIENSKIVGSIIFNSKIERSSIDEISEINNCNLYTSTLNGKMTGGIFRSGKIGKFATLDNVKIDNGENNYFGLKQHTIDDQSSDKKDIINKKEFLNKW